MIETLKEKVGIKTHWVLVVITYALDKAFPRFVLAHEVPLLKARFGGHRVTVEQDPYLDNGKELHAPTVDPRQELLRLKRLYQPYAGPDGMNPVDEVFVDGSRDLEAFYAGDFVMPDLPDPHTDSGAEEIVDLAPEGEEESDIAATEDADGNAIPQGPPKPAAAVARAPQPAKA